MHIHRRVSVAALLLTTAICAPSCKGEPETPAAPGSPEGPAPDAPDKDGHPPVPDEGPLPVLRSGTKEPKVLAEVKATFAAKHSDSADYLEFSVATPPGFDAERVHVDLPNAVAVMDRDAVLVRLPATGAPRPAAIKGNILASSYERGGKAWTVTPFSVEGAPAKSDRELPKRWADAMSNWLKDDFGASHPWRKFASGRVHAALGGSSGGGAAVATRTPRRPTTELSELMYTTTAATSMQEALQIDRGLRIRFDRGDRSVPLTELKPPKLEDHPFDEMIRALPDPEGGTPEPLAAAAPADFWYVRFDDIRVMLHVLDEADTWITPVVHIMEERAEVRDLADRYQRQLGLRRSGLAKALGHTVIDRVAIVGSDAYVREGSDVTFIFDVSNQSVFDTELERHMSGHKSEVSGIVQSTVSHGTHSITVMRDPSGTVNQHRAKVGKLSIVSNSETACKAVLDTIDGKRDKLSDQRDLAYMLARDPGEHEGFAFLGDRFIAQVVGPKQKILAARRQQALAELLTPGYAALLYGWLEGKAPADTESLIASGLLDREELTHVDGGEIEFTPGTAARSAWGRPDSLTPLLDMPAPELVTPAERDAYNRFSEGYQDYWRQFIDPIAIRLDMEDKGGESTAKLDIRVLPLISGTDYRSLEEIVGHERIEVPDIGDGLQMVWAVGADSELRKDLDRGASALTGSSKIGLGWLGDWVMVGTLDRRALVDLMALVDEDAQLPHEQEDRDAFELETIKAAGKLPLYVAAHVRNPAALVATLGGVRAAVNGVAPGTVQWGEDHQYKEHPIVKVGINRSAGGQFAGYADAIAIYYVQAGDALIIALDPKVLEGLIDRVESGDLPKRGIDGGPQFVAEAELAHGKASWTAAMWALQGQANRTQHSARKAAEILLRGDPSLKGEAKIRELGLAYFGTYPVSASGHSDFELDRFGARDPIHGSTHAPTYPSLPVAGSPIAALMERLTGARATVAFDREPAKMDPPARSLHTTLEVHLGKPKG